MDNVFSDEQMQHLVNIILSCERWSQLDSLRTTLKSIGMEDEADAVNKRAIEYNNFMFSEIETLSGRDRLDPYIDDIYGHSEDFDRV